MFSAGGPTREPPREHVLNAFSEYQYFVRHQYGAAERELVRIFDLEDLENTSFWVAISDDKERLPLSPSIMFSIHMLNDFYPKCKNFLARDTEENIEIISNKKSNKASKVRIFLREEENRLTDPERIIKIIKAVRSIYEELCHIHNIDAKTLAIGSLDSGSDKQIDFIGVSQIVDSFNNLVNSVWNRIRFSAEEKYESKVRSAVSAIDLMSIINAGKANKTLTKTEAEKLKRTVMRSVEELFKNGVYTDEMQKTETASVDQIIHVQKEMIEYKPRMLRKKKVKDENVDEATLPGDGIDEEHLD